MGGRTLRISEAVNRSIDKKVEIRRAMLRLWRQMKEKFRVEKKNCYTNMEHNCCADTKTKKKGKMREIMTRGHHKGICRY
jgi:hypothetical protein